MINETIGRNKKIEIIENFVKTLFRNSVAIDNQVNNSDYISGIDGRKYNRHKINSIYKEINPCLYLIKINAAEKEKCKKYVANYISVLKDIYNFIQGEIVHYDKNFNTIDSTDDMKFIEETDKVIKQYLEEI